MIIFESLLTTFEESVIFLVVGAVEKIDSSLKPRTICKFNHVKLVTFLLNMELNLYQEFGQSNLAIVSIEEG
jgi:hypothetical protein